MTLDEARETLGLHRGASEADIRDAFRRRAREVHPDRHPSADDVKRKHLSREFDRAREARDILVKFTTDSARATTPSSGSSARFTSSAPPTAQPASTTRGTATAPPPRRERARPRTSESRPRSDAPRVTLRFDEFVRASDAEGFGPGARTPRLIDWARVTAWSMVGALTALVFGGGYLAAYVL